MYDYLKSLRADINRLRRKEREVVKMIQSRCCHMHVEQKLIRSRLTYATQLGPISAMTTDYNVRLVCNDCGKTLRE